MSNIALARALHATTGKKAPHVTSCPSDDVGHPVVTPTPDLIEWLSRHPEAYNPPSIPGVWEGVHPSSLPHEPQMVRRHKARRDYLANGTPLHRLVDIWTGRLKTPL